MNNDKKMPQDKNLDQKKPQQVSDQGIGQQHGFQPNKDKPQQPAAKPEWNKDSGAKPQSSIKNDKKLDDDQNELDDDDDRVTERNPSRK